MHAQGSSVSVSRVMFLELQQYFFSGRPNGQHSQKQILDQILLHRELILTNIAEGAEQLESITYAMS